ncbi:MAG: hypothetical protein ACK5WC_04670, partial [Aphanizomenon sp.]
SCSWEGERGQKSFGLGFLGKFCIILLWDFCRWQLIILYALALSNIILLVLNFHENNREY